MLDTLDRPCSHKFRSAAGEQRSKALCFNKERPAEMPFHGVRGVCGLLLGVVLLLDLRSSANTVMSNSQLQACVQDGTVRLRCCRNLSFSSKISTVRAK